MSRPPPGHAPPPEDGKAPILSTWGRTRLFVPLAPPSKVAAPAVRLPGPPAVLSGDGAPPVVHIQLPSGSAVPVERPPVWVYEQHSHYLSDEVLLDLYVSLRTLAKPVRLEVQEEVLRREILRRMRVAP